MSARWSARSSASSKPEGLVGVHLQQIFAFPTGDAGRDGQARRRSSSRALPISTSSRSTRATSDIQSKRPGTLGYGLVDSPVGAARLEHRAVLRLRGRGRRVCRSRPLPDARLDLLVHRHRAARRPTSISRTRSSGSGYREERNDTPTGVAVFPWDFRSVRSFAERANNIVHWTEMPTGGHFAATDAPDLLVEDVRKFFGGLI